MLRPAMPKDVRHYLRPFRARREIANNPPGVEEAVSKGEGCSPLPAPLQGALQDIANTDLGLKPQATRLSRFAALRALSLSIDSSSRSISETRLRSRPSITRTIRRHQQMPLLFARLLSSITGRRSSQAAKRRRRVAWGFNPRCGSQNSGRPDGAQVMANDLRLCWPEHTAASTWGSLLVSIFRVLRRPLLPQAGPEQRYAP